MSRFHKTSEKFPCLLAMKSLEISHLACTRQKRCENHSRGGGVRGRHLREVWVGCAAEAFKP